MKPTMTLQLTTEEINRLRNIAQENGLLIGRGTKATSGSVNKMLKALAAGELVVAKITTVTIAPEATNAST